MIFRRLHLKRESLGLICKNNYLCADHSPDQRSRTLLRQTLDFEGREAEITSMPFG